VSPPRRLGEGPFGCVGKGEFWWGRQGTAYCRSDGIKILIVVSKSFSLPGMVLKSLTLEYKERTYDICVGRCDSAYVFVRHCRKPSSSLRVGMQSSSWHYFQRAFLTGLGLYPFSSNYFVELTNAKICDQNNCKITVLSDLTLFFAPNPSL
jgi:hypothetical protein